jgi:hypothetical protein
MTGIIRVRIAVVDRATPQLRRAHWLLWWMAWGTNGLNRRRALVVVR